MQFALNISCENAAFQPVHDDASEAELYKSASAEVLNIVAEFTANGMYSQRSGSLFDSNGKRVGQWSLNSDDEEEDDAAATPGPWTMREEGYDGAPAWSLFDNGQRAAVGLIEDDARRICEAMNRKV